MEPKRPRSKTIVTITIIVLVLIGFAFYYVSAVRNSDTQPASVDRAS